MARRHGSEPTPETRAMRRRPGLTRRDFMRGGAGAAIGGLLASGRAGADEAAARPTSQVVLIRDKEVLDEQLRIRASVLETMLDQAVTRLLGADSAAEAWSRLIKKDDVVGIKSNVWRYLPTPAALEQAIQDRVVAAGVAETRVSINDRGVLRDPVFERATALINVRPMRTHNWSGLGTCIKNYVMFVPRPQEYHGNSCEPLGSIWKLPLVRDKTRLNILVMLTPQFHSVGPHSFSKSHIWPYNGLIVGTDPVAVDAVGAQIIEAKRREHFGESRPISPPPLHINAAETTYGLGVADLDRISVISIGWREGALIPV